MDDDAARDALVERLFEATVGCLELFSVHLGWRLGLYRALQEGGPLTAAGLAEAAGIDGRYAQEWLEQQAVAGFLAVVDGDAPRFGLPPGHADVLVDPESAFHVVPFAPMLVGIAGALPGVVEAYRTGAGVAYADYGPDMREGQGGINRPGFVHDLAGWLAAVPSVHERLTDGRPARIADLGCGQGWSTRALALAYPQADVVGIDLDVASIVDAQRGPSAPRFVAGGAEALAAEGPFDLVCVFEALHDMSDPVGVLRAVREALAPGGAVLVADERVADAFTAPGDVVERMMYGWSVTHCLPAARAEQPSAALGTVLRAPTVRRLGAEAGFAQVEVLDIEHDFFRFYLLRADDGGAGRG